MGTSKINAGGNPAVEKHHIQGRVEILQVASCYRNQDKLWPDEPVSSYMQTLPMYKEQSGNQQKQLWNNAFQLGLKSNMRPFA